MSLALRLLLGAAVPVHKRKTILVEVGRRTAWYSPISQSMANVLSTASKPSSEYKSRIERCLHRVNLRIATLTALTDLLCVRTGRPQTAGVLILLAETTLMAHLW